MCASTACFCALASHAYHIRSHASICAVDLCPCYSSEFLLFPCTAPVTPARILLHVCPHCCRGRGREQAELLGALVWFEAVGLARRAHCSGSVFQEGRARFQLPDILMLQIAVWFGGLLSPWWDAQSAPQTARQSKMLTLPLPAPLQTSEKFHPNVLTGQMPTRVISSHTESQCGLNTHPEMWQNHLPLNFHNLCQ